MDTKEIKARDIWKQICDQVFPFVTNYHGNLEYENQCLIDDRRRKVAYALALGDKEIEILSEAFEGMANLAHDDKDKIIYSLYEKFKETIMDNV